MGLILGLVFFGFFVGEAVHFFGIVGIGADNAVAVFHEADGTCGIILDIVDEDDFFWGGYGL